MATKLGQSTIKVMQPKSILWDNIVRGFNARRQFSNVITYSVVYRTNEGRQRWHKLGRHPILTPDLARKEAIKILREVALGGDPSAERHDLRHGLSVAQLCQMYLDDMQSLKNNGKKQTTILSDVSRIKNHIVPGLGHHKVATITSEQVEQFMNEQSRGSAKRIVSLTGAIFSFAIKRKLRETNPVSSIEKPKDVKKTRRLSNAEYQQLGTAIKGKNDIFLFLALTGFRRNEARLLRWSEVDIPRQSVMLMDSKTGQSTRPLSCAAIDIINRQPHQGQYVFQPITDFHRHFAKLGLPKDVTPHTLRHSFASLAGDLGMADSTIAGLLGHARSSITSRYIHLDKSLIEAADKVAQETIRLMGA
jgi:integrase